MLNGKCTVANLQDKVKITTQEQEICIIFSRYPRPGFSKTRLIPHLGSVAAADLQRRMTEAVVAQAKGLQQVRVELAMADAEKEEMASWLGRLPWQQQVGEGLGERMEYAFSQAFQRGYRRVIIVGADCPKLSTKILAQAFQELHKKEMVLGPTTDGGYYLIGLRQPKPELFVNIDWGSDQVLAQTLAISDKKGIPTALLDTLPDVDVLDDLENLPSFLKEHLP